MSKKGYIIAGAVGIVAYIGLNLSSDFRDAKDDIFSDIKEGLCEKTGQSLYNSACAPEVSPD